MFFKKYQRKKMLALFAAHAPEPPPFFAMEADSNAPRLPDISTVADEADREKARLWVESRGAARPDTLSDDLHGFMVSYERAMKAYMLWQTEQQERLYFAWRRGYALKMAAMIEALK